MIHREWNNVCYLEDLHNQPTGAACARLRPCIRAPHRRRKQRTRDAILETSRFAVDQGQVTSTNVDYLHSSPVNATFLATVFRSPRSIATADGRHGQRNDNHKTASQLAGVGNFHNVDYLLCSPANATISCGALRSWTTSVVYSCTMSRRSTTID